MLVREGRKIVVVNGGGNSLSRTDEMSVLFKPKEVKENIRIIQRQQKRVRNF